MSDERVPEFLIGSWRILAFQDRQDPGDPWIDTYGPGVKGLVTYERSGALSVHVAPDITSSQAYTAYFGTWELGDAAVVDDVASGTVLHHIVAATPPELVDEPPERTFRVDADRLLLGDDVTWRRLCERA